MNSVLHITYFGDSGLLLPLALVLALFLARNAPADAARWLIAIVAALAMTTVSKLFYGVTSRTFLPLNFRMISGHMVLAFSIWPVAAYLFGGAFGFRAGNPRFRDGTGYSSAAAAVAALVAALGCCVIGYSRIRIGAHTLSEVVAGGILGACVSFYTLRHWSSGTRSGQVALPSPQFALPAVALVLIVCYGHPAPTQRLINVISGSIIRMTGWGHAGN